MAGRIPDSVIDEVNRKSDIVDVVSSYVNLSRKGARWWGLCPFHSEKTPSFSVSQDTNLFYCFGCQKGGGVVQFLMDAESLSFPESIHRLAEKAGIEIPTSADNRDLKDNRKALEELYARTSKTFQWLLWNHPEAAEARDYLGTRGMRRETCQIFNIGWAPSDGEWLYAFLLEKKYSAEFLASSGLFSRKSPKWAFFVDRLIFPIMPDSKSVTAFSGRGFSDKAPKYKNSPETLLYKKSQQLYGLGQARKSIQRTKRVYLCEGNIDVLACYQSGVQETVAPLGTAFTENHARILKRFAENIVLMFDGDEAGLLGSMRASIIAEEHGFAVHAVKMPSGSDPAEIMEKNGPEALKKIVSEPIIVFRYLLDSIHTDKLGISGEGQEEALKELTPYLHAVGSDVRREAYLRQLAEAVNSNPHTMIREYYNRHKQRKWKTTDRIAKPRHDKFVLASNELYLMIAIAVRTEFFSVLKSSLVPEVFRDKRALSVYRAIDELSVNGTVPRTDMIVDKLDNPQLVKLILEKASTQEFDENIEETIREKIVLIRIRTLIEESQEIVNVLSNDPNRERTKARMLRIKEIDQEIINIRQGDND